MAPRPKRPEETAKTQKLQLGSAYSRKQLADLVEVAPPLHSRDWTGIVDFENCVFLFVTLDKTGRTAKHQYHDQFDGSSFYWDSQASNRPETPKIVRLMTEGEEVQLFARLREKIRGKAQPFYYCGRLARPSSYASQPVRFVWRLADFRTDCAVRGSTNSPRGGTCRRFARREESKARERQAVTSPARTMIGASWKASVYRPR